MLFTIDVGNTNINFGFFDKETKEIIQSFRLATPSTQTTTDEMAINIKSAIALGEKKELKQITGSIFCSVVPYLNHNITKLMLNYFNSDILCVGINDFSSFKIDYDPPHSVGIDRLVNLKSANHLYPNSDIIVIDLGTATTIDVMKKNKHYLGGMILPGISSSLEGLYDKTSQLPKIALKKPEKIIGKTTKENMQNGIYYLYRYGLERIILEISKNYFDSDFKNIKVIVTGGLSSFISEESEIPVEIQPHLTLLGLKEILLKKI